MTFVIKVVGLKRLQRKMLRRKNRLTGGNARGVSKKANMQALAVVDRWRGVGGSRYQREPCWQDKKDGAIMSNPITLKSCRTKAI